MSNMVNRIPGCVTVSTLKPTVGTIECDCEASGLSLLMIVDFPLLSRPTTMTDAENNQVRIMRICGTTLALDPAQPQGKRVEQAHASAEL